MGDDTTGMGGTTGCDVVGAGSTPGCDTTGARGVLGGDATAGDGDTAGAGSMADGDTAKAGGSADADTAKAGGAADADTARAGGAADGDAAEVGDAAGGGARTGRGRGRTGEAGSTPPGPLAPGDQKPSRRARSSPSRRVCSRNLPQSRRTWWSRRNCSRSGHQLRERVRSRIPATCARLNNSSCPMPKIVLPPTPPCRIEMTIQHAKPPKVTTVTKAPKNCLMNATAARIQPHKDSSRRTAD